MKKSCQSKTKYGDALFEKSYECGSGAGMKHIGFYLDGLNLTVNGKKVGMSCTPEAHLKLMCENNGVEETAAKKEIGNE
jgi:hypothetical protein